jgi:hydrogenase/urease accessory protein HupE
MRRALLLVLAVLLAFGTGGRAFAHEVRPAYLEITELAPGDYTILWKQPVVGELAISLTPKLSNGWLDAPPSDVETTPYYRIKTWRIRTKEAAPLEGREITVVGLDRTITDALVRVAIRGHDPVQTILRPDQPSMVLKLAPPPGLHIPAYLRLGVEHILTGIDHLSFVLGLILLVGLRWRLIKAITAFTVAHSITLAAAALGLVHVRSALVEALVALSILFLAVEVVRAKRGEGGVTARWPWLIAFAFGLLHGLAFAGALAEVGLPQGAIPLALFLFNVGVEIGQLLFVGVVALLILAWRRLAPRFAGASWPTAIPPYAIGAFAAFWFFQRVAAVFA